ncbi:hypothetical protein C8Q80DRAFT_176909 [Daedaleopsis nitida]|nr:hypothetical protein C8Q80DRAFT_176909 [Daedaleopsis nitida]
MGPLAVRSSLVLSSGPLHTSPYSVCPHHHCKCSSPAFVYANCYCLSSRTPSISHYRLRQRPACLLLSRRTTPDSSLACAVGTDPTLAATPGEPSFASPSRSAPSTGSPIARPPSLGSRASKARDLAVSRDSSLATCRCPLERVDPSLDHPAFLCLQAQQTGMLVGSDWDITGLDDWTLAPLAVPHPSRVVGMCVGARVSDHRGLRIWGWAAAHSSAWPAQYPEAAPTTSSRTIPLCRPSTPSPARSSALTCVTRGASCSP